VAAGLARWTREYEGLGVAELRRLKQLEEGDKKLKQLVADLSPVARKCCRWTPARSALAYLRGE